MNNEERKELLKEMKSDPIDCFGLSKKGLHSEEENQATIYDSFCLEDSLRIISARDNLNEIKSMLSPRLDKNTGLYSVTVGDVNSDYYYFATMFNRMSNSVYSQRVWRNVSLLEGIIKNIRRDYLQNIERTISQHNFGGTMNQEENKQNQEENKHL